MINGFQGESVSDTVLYDEGHCYAGTSMRIRWTGIDNTFLYSCVLYHPASVENCRFKFALSTETGLSHLIKDPKRISNLHGLQYGSTYIIRYPIIGTTFKLTL